MSEILLSYNDFINIVNNIDYTFKTIVSEIRGIEYKYNNEDKKIDKEVDNYCNSLISSQVKTFVTLKEKLSKHPLLSLLNNNDYLSIIFSNSRLFMIAEGEDDAPLASKNEQEEEIDYKRVIKDFNKDYKKTLRNKKLNELLELYDSLYKELNYNIYNLNEMSFDKGLDYTVKDESIVIGEDEYKATEIPEVTFAFFDTLPFESKVLVAKTILIINKIIIVIEKMVDHYNSDNYKRDLIDKTNKYLEDELLKQDNNKNTEVNNKLNELLDCYNNIIPYLLDNRNHLNDFFSMNNIKNNNCFNKYINIGSLKRDLINYNYYKDYLSNIDKEGLISKSIKYPYLLDLSNKGNVIINTNEVNKEIVDFVYQLTMDFILSAPLKKVSLALVDVDEMDEFDLVLSMNKDYLRNNNLIFGGRVATDNEEFRALVKDLTKKINEIKADYLAPKDVSNIFEYNELGDESIGLHLLVYVNSPKELDSYIKEKLTNIMVNGPRCGIFTIILNRLPSDKHKSFFDKVSDNSINFNYDNNTFSVGNDTFTPNKGFKEKDLSKFFKTLLELL